MRRGNSTAYVTPSLLDSFVKAFNWELTLAIAWLSVIFMAAEDELPIVPLLF
jgi:hypothetical protein